MEYSTRGIADSGPLLLRMEDVARRLSISRSKAYQMAASGELPGVLRVGTSYRVSVKHLEDWIEANTSRVPSV